MQLIRATCLAILAAVVQAQSIGDLVSQIPSCALSCLTTAINASGCGLTDYVCQCTTGHNAILANSAGCISKACSTADTLTTTNISNQICSIAVASGSSSAVASAALSAASVAPPTTSPVA